MSVVWLIVVACGACWLVGMAMGLSLAKAGARGDRRAGYLDFTVTKIPVGTSVTSAVLDPYAQRAALADRIRPYTDKGQSAA